MKRRLFALASAAVPLLLSACAGVQMRPEIPQVSPQEVVAMSKEGQNTAVIIDKIQYSGSVYILTASDLVQLAKDGVPYPVLDHMQHTYIKAVERNARRNYSAYPQFFYVPVL